eukprot:Skav205646  [mRNA]  locus=scaffold458:108810:111275:+ [translate_table: standard]
MATFGSPLLAKPSIHWQASAALGRSFRPPQGQPRPMSARAKAKTTVGPTCSGKHFLQNCFFFCLYPAARKKASARKGLSPLASQEQVVDSPQGAHEMRLDVRRHIYKKWLELESLLVWPALAAVLSSALGGTEYNWMAQAVILMSYSLPMAQCIIKVEESPRSFRKVCSLLTTAALLLWPVICFSPLILLGVKIQTILACGPWIRGLIVASIYLRPSAETTWPTRSWLIRVFWDIPLLSVTYVVDVVGHRFGMAPFFRGGHHHGERATEFASEIYGTPFYLGCRPLAHHVKPMKDRGVGLVVNMTEEWPGPKRQYETQGIAQIRFQTLDSEPPTLQVLEEGRAAGDAPGRRASKRKAKEEVERRASKGRKIRYRPIDKLQNFMAARPRGTGEGGVTVVAGGEKWVVSRFVPSLHHRPRIPTCEIMAPRHLSPPELLGTG